MVERVRDDLLAALRARLAQKGVDPDSEFAEYPVGAICEDSVPFMGNVHIPAGRVISRAESDKRFRFLRR